MSQRKDLGHLDLKYPKSSKLTLAASVRELSKGLESIQELKKAELQWS